MRIAYSLLLFAIVLFSACGGGKDLAQTPQRPMPEWVKSRPIDQAYYIGIGSANKRIDPADYANAAKKNALNDLASEIRVTVKSESFLNTMQVNMQIQEAYNQTIATTANESIEGFDVVDVYETETEYFVFYRLSRAKHAQIRQDKKNRAMSGAFDQLKQARESRDRADVALAGDLYLHGLFELKDYWNEANNWRDGNEDIFIDNTIYREFRQMVNDIILSANRETIELSASNEFRDEVVIKATFNGQPVRGFKLNYSFDNGQLRNQLTGETDMNGELRIAVQKVNLANPSNALSVRVDMAQFRPNDLDRKLVNPLTEGLRSSPLNVPIRATMPVIFMEVQERNMGRALGSERVAAPVRQELSNRGFQFTPDRKQADYFIEIKADTREGGTSQGFFVAYLDMQITVRNTAGVIVYQNSENNVKGLQLNFEAAGIESYKAGTQRMERTIAPALVNSLF